MTQAATTPATVEAIDDATLAPVGFHFAVNLMIEELNAVAHPDPAHERFLQLCRAAVQAFPKSASNLTDAEILANPATPELLRYLLGALANYAARADVAHPEGKQWTARDRQTAIANALGLTGEHGGGHNGRLISEQQHMECLMFFRKELEAHRSGNPRASEQESLLRAFDRTYDKIYGPDTEKGRSDREIQKNIKQLASVLAQHGYAKIAETK